MKICDFSVGRVRVVRRSQCERQLLSESNALWTGDLCNADCACNCATDVFVERQRLETWISEGAFAKR